MNSKLTTTAVPEPATAVEAPVEIPEPAQAAPGELNRLRPGIVAAHVIGVALVQGMAMMLVPMIAVLGKKNFSANEWHTLVVTAAPTVLFIFSIFWNDVFGRMRYGRYLTLIWAVACLPLAAVAGAKNIWMLLIPHVISSVGGAGYHPAAGELFKRLYPAEQRGRVYGILWAVSVGFSGATSYGLGLWQHRDANAFRVFIPIVVVLQAIGMGILAWLGRKSGTSERVLNATPWHPTKTFEPVGHMKQALAEDPAFARYEAAYMTYGVGWMICYALLPNLVTDKLKLNFDAIGASTGAAYSIGMILMLWPAGWLLDKLGAVRSTGLSFAMLTLYPLGLMLARGTDSLFFASVWYGLAHAGASVGWMLGPVSMAPTPEKVPQYVAIHATLVGVRGKIFQFLGVGLYALTGAVTLPMLIAAVCFIWSAQQMWALHSRMQTSKAK